MIKRINFQTSVYTTTKGDHFIEMYALVFARESK